MCAASYSRLSTPVAVNTWMGDPLRAHMTATQNEVIREDNLIEQAATSGAYLHDRMLEMHEKYPGAVGAPRA